MTPVQGYLDEPEVAAGSTVETFAALRLEIDSWRWAGVPLHLRAGQGLGHHRAGGRRGAARRTPAAVLP
jgi:glucose-6-phosphate 1-dehydrogenase